MSNTFKLSSLTTLKSATPAELELINRNFWLIEQALNSVGATTPTPQGTISPPGGTISHHNLLDLTTYDDHSQYLLLSGRTIGFPAGQRIYQTGIQYTSAITLRQTIDSPASTDLLQFEAIDGHVAFGIGLINGGGTGNSISMATGTGGNLLIDAGATEFYMSGTTYYEFRGNTVTSVYIKRGSTQHLGSNNLLEFQDNTSSVLTYFDKDGVYHGPVVSGGASSFIDSLFSILDNVDNTKKFGFEASGITTGQTRIYTVPDQNGSLAILERENQTFTKAQIVAHSNNSYPRLKLTDDGINPTSSNYIECSSTLGSPSFIVNSSGYPAAGKYFVGTGSSWSPAVGLQSLATGTNKLQLLQDLNGNVVVTSSGGDPPASGYIGTVNRTGQTANISSPVNLTNATPAGFYIIECQMVCTVTGSGTLTLNINYTDDGGARTNIPVSSLTLTSGQFGTGFKVVYLASGNITWTATGLTSGTYNLRIRANYLGA